MNADSRVEAFRHAPELAACERSAEPVPSVWRDCLKSCPRGCCEQVSQTLAGLDKRVKEKSIICKETPEYRQYSENKQTPQLVKPLMKVMIFSFSNFL